MRILFYIAAAYDGILGLVFLAAPLWAFETFAVTPPNHPGYVQFPAALLLVFALMFLRIARDPPAERDLIPYGILLKLAYCSVVTAYWLTGGVPDIWKPFVLADARNPWRHAKPGRMLPA
jgi:hypothetical protein